MPLELRWRNGIAYLCGSIGGKRLRKSLGTRNTKIAASIAAEEAARLQRAEIYGIENEASFAEACIQYLENLSEGSANASYLTPVIKEIGKHKLAKIKPGQIQVLAKKLYPNLKPQTWNRYVIVPVSAVINFAHGLGMCPPIRIKRFSPRDEKKKTAITREWIDKFREHALTPHLAAYALFLHTTAARSTEAILLRPADLDLEKRYGTSATVTKTGHRREFWLTQEMADELKRLPPKQIGWGKHKGELRIFGWADCKGPIEPWKETCKRAGLEYVSPYEAGRHSFATEGITRQERSPVMVAKIGNWSDTRTLLKNYAHPENMEAFVEDVYGQKKVVSERLKVVK
jgi:integrase